MHAPEQRGLTPLRRLAEWLGLRRNLVILLIAVLVIGAGEELWMRFVPKYLQALGAGVFVIGLYDGLRTLLAAIYAYPGGKLADRWGHRRAFIAFNLLSITGYTLVLLVPHWGAVIVGMFLFLSWTWFSVPAMFSLVAETLSASRHSMGVATQSVIKRLPIMIAPIFGGMLIDRFGVIPGVRIGLATSIVLSAATILVQRQLNDSSIREDAAVEAWNFRQTVGQFNASLHHLLLSDILIRFCERLPFAWVVIFAMDYAGVSAEQVGVLIMVEMLAAVACTIPASHFADRHGREGFVVVTFVMFTLFPIALLVSRTFPMLVLAFAIRGLKEFGDAPRKALIIAYSEPARRGQMIGAYYFIRDLIVSTGAIIGAYLWKIGPAANFTGAAILGAVGTILYILQLRRSG
jgi:predicted MFS family arabinose efflux permease